MDHNNKKKVVTGKNKAKQKNNQIEKEESQSKI